MNATLSNFQNTGRKLVRQTHRCLQIYRERLQITAVNPDDVRSEFNCAFQLLFIMYFDQHIQLLCLSALVKKLQLRLAQASDDEQDGVGAMRASFEYLELIDDEVFAEARQFRLRRCFEQVTE